MTQKERYAKAIAWFKENMPHTESELNYRNHFELLVAVVLSAQCTDKRVNMVTPELFSRYPNAHAMSKSSPDEILEYIRSVSYPNSKAKHLYKSACMLEEEFNGIVPQDPAQLQKLPGVGRKTANVMSVVAFRKPAMPVDTHVFRVSNRLGLTKNSKTPLETEKELTKHIPAELLGKAHHWLVLHGRYVCTARNPNCAECGLSPVCLYFKKNKAAKDTN